MEPVLRTQPTPAPSPIPADEGSLRMDRPMAHPVLPPIEAMPSSGSSDHHDPVAPPPPSSAAPFRPAKPSRLPLALGIAAIIGITAVAISLKPEAAPVPVAVGPSVQVQPMQPVVQPSPQAVPQAQPQVQVQPQLQPAPSADVPPVAGAVKDSAGKGAPAMWGIWLSPGSAESVNRAIASDGISVVAQRVTTPGVRVIAFVRPGVQGESVGLIPGDLIVSYNGQPTPTVEALNAIHLSNTAGAPSTLVVIRGGQTVSLGGPVGAQPQQGGLGGAP